MTTRFLATILALTVLCSLWPRPAAGEEPILTLDEALRRTLAQHPGIISAEAVLEASDHRVYETRAGFLPQAIVSAGYHRATINQAAPPYLDLSALSSLPIPVNLGSMFSRKSMDSFNTWNLGLNVNQLIWDFGRTLGTYKSAKSFRDASSSDLEAAKQSLWLGVTQTYFTVLATQELMAAAEDIKKQMEKHLEQATVQSEAGIRQRIDVTRAASDLANAQLALVRATNARRLARVALNNAMGLPQETDYRVERPPASEPVVIASMEQAVQEAISRRPEVQALRRRVQAATELIDVAKSGWYPTIAANAGWNYFGYEINNLPFNWTIGASLSWNAFSGLQTVHSIDEAEANLRAQQASLENFQIAIRGDVESAAVAYQEAQEKLTPAAALLKSATETMFLAEGRYAAGTGSIVEVTDAQAVLTQAKVGLIQAEYDIEIARAKLLKSLGDIPGLKGE